MLLFQKGQIFIFSRSKFRFLKVKFEGNFFTKKFFLKFGDYENNWNPSSTFALWNSNQKKKLKFPCEKFSFFIFHFTLISFQFTQNFMSSTNKQLRWIFNYDTWMVEKASKHHMNKIHLFIFFTLQKRRWGWMRRNFSAHIKCMVLHFAFIFSLNLLCLCLFCRVSSVKRKFFCFSDYESDNVKFHKKKRISYI